jgi:hypothetical protein
MDERRRVVLGEDFEDARDLGTIFLNPFAESVPPLLIDVLGVGP